jgi:di/tripeptidase
MKMKTAFLTSLVVASMGLSLSAASLTQTIANINADAKKDPARAAQSVSASTKVPVATLEKEKAAHPNLTYGDLFGAHTVAKASGKSFDEIAAMKAKGQSWDKIAETAGVSTDSKQKQATVTAAPTATPPKKSLFQEQKDRYK